MSEILSIPEVAGLDSASGVIRISPELNVPLTDRVRRLIDTPAFRRLARIAQLGLVPLVYPGATHSRFEHSLGVYRNALLFLRQLSHDERFRSGVGRPEAELFIAAALLHDIGHWPFCHPIEDIHLESLPSHEDLAARHLLDGELPEALRDDWGIEPQRVVAILSQPASSTAGSILRSCLSGPIDIDKLDYLGRDSLHAGVPYGRHFDQGRLVSSLCLNAAGDGLAITEKGKTAAELMLFARYVMFSEVYWHHGVRAATAMLQRAFHALHERLDLDALFRSSDAEVVDALLGAAGEGERELLDGIFGARRQLYKRVAQYSIFEGREIYELLARRPFAWLVECAAALAGLVGEESGVEVRPHELLIDAPPVHREVEFDIEVFFRKEGRHRRLDEVSPVVRTLAREQFDDYVKRVRVFAHPRVAEGLRSASLERLIPEAVRRTAHEAGSA